MAAPFNALTNKAEAAVLDLISDATYTAPPTFFTGQSSSTLTLPAVIIHAEQGEERPQYSGNFVCKVKVMVKSSADVSTLAAHRLVAGEAFDVMFSEEIVADLSGALSDFTAIGVNGRHLSESVDDRTYISELDFDLYCCGSDIS